MELCQDKREKTPGWMSLADPVSEHFPDLTRGLPLEPPPKELALFLHRLRPSLRSKS